ncbi:ABC transporter substrate-binding protein [Chelativorans xinjiangense]|uniref:ABC transporter substrate-binding protein n=1 Tax=Chelativorans xinjiangense TaxID=2681485 RepID=UPI00135B7A8B|nr:ABC transporter substrate-binding protein [Chelativorans xinjiangense]
MNSMGKGIAGLMLAVAASAASPSQASAETTLYYAPSSDLASLDPIASTGSVPKIHALMIYDTLFAIDGKGIVQPQMVENYTLSEGGLTYRFTLREGLKWHDGVPVTPEDCIASLKRWGAADTSGKLLFDFIKEFRVVDRSNFEFELNEPFGATIEVLGRSLSRIPFIFPERVAMTDPGTPITDYTGSGPFIFVEEEWVPGNKLVYRKNPDYVPRNEPASGWAGGKVVKVDRVVWNIQPDKQSAMTALLAGEIDIWEGVPSDLLPILEADPTVKFEDSTGWFAYLMVNHRHPPFDNVKAREALAWLIDQTAYLQVMVGNPSLYFTCASMYDCKSASASDVNSEAIAGYDPEKARQLFEESGWDFSQPIVILDPTDEPEIHAAMLLTTDRLRSIGLTVDHQAMDWATLTKRRAVTGPTSEGGWDIMMTFGASTTFGDPFFHSRFGVDCEKPYLAGACDKELQDLRLAWAKAGSHDERVGIAGDFQARAFSLHTPWYPLGQWAVPYAVSTKIDGFIAGINYPVFWNIEKQ